MNLIGGIGDKVRDILPPHEVFWRIQYTQEHVAGYSFGLSGNYSALGYSTEFIQGWVKGLHDNTVFEIPKDKSSLNKFYSKDNTLMGILIKLNV